MLTRVDRPELMDDPCADGAELSASLAHVAQATIRLGGVRPLVRAVLPHLQPGGPSTLLDVGSGNGGVALDVAARLSRRGYAVQCTAADFSPAVLASVLPGMEHRVACDARGLPFADGSFDVVVSVLMLHHFGPEDVVRVLAEMARVARRGVVISDLRRSLRGLWGAKLLAETVWRGNRLTRHDAPVSARRAYTTAELSELATRAGLDRIRADRHFPFRLILAGRRGAIP